PPKRADSPEPSTAESTNVPTPAGANVPALQLPSQGVTSASSASPRSSPRKSPRRSPPLLLARSRKVPMKSTTMMISTTTSIRTYFGDAGGRGRGGGLQVQVVGRRHQPVEQQLQRGLPRLRRRRGAAEGAPQRRGRAAARRRRGAVGLVLALVCGGLLESRLQRSLKSFCAIGRCWGQTSGRPTGEG
ncbi:unnamed protein product, partial [Prorocentrum cordatum]